MHSSDATVTAALQRQPNAPANTLRVRAATKTDALYLQIEAKVKQLEDQKVPVKVDMNLLTGSQWTTVYTTSTGDVQGPAEQAGTPYLQLSSRMQLDVVVISTYAILSHLVPPMF